MSLHHLAELGDAFGSAEFLGGGGGLFGLLHLLGLGAGLLDLSDFFGAADKFFGDVVGAGYGGEDGGGVHGIEGLGSKSGYALHDVEDGAELADLVLGDG